MWTARSEPITRGLRLTIDRDLRAATYSEIVNAWRALVYNWPADPAADPLSGAAETAAVE